MSKWQYIKLSKLCTRIGDGLHGTPEYSDDSDIFFINGNNLKFGKIEITSNTNRVSVDEFEKNFIALNENSLLISINGTLGNMAFYNNENVILGKSAAYLNFKSELNRFYYYYFQLTHIQKYFYDVATGSTIKNLSLKSIQDFEVPVPEEIEWKNIYYVLSSLDSKIELNNRINIQLDAMAKTLYNYWFVQFDFPDKDGKPYKTSGGNMVWNEQLKREIPEGWEVAKMADWIEADKSGDWGKEELEGNFTKKVTCIRGADINGLNGLAELKPPIRYILEKNSSKILNSHDLIIEISGGSPVQSTGRLAFITDATIKRFENPLICSNFCKPISIKNKKLLYNFVYYWKSLYDAGIFFGYEGKTSGIKNLLFDSFVSSYYTVVPDDKIVDQFYNIMENIQEKKQTTLAENQQLSSLRDWLLPMLMNGQVTVGDSGENKASYEIEEEMRMAAEPGIN